MKTPRRAFACLATAFTVATMALLGPATPANAAATVSCSIVPSSLTLGDRTQVVEFDVDSTYRYWWIDFDYPKNNLMAAVTSYSDFRNTIFNPRHFENSDAGLKQFKVKLHQIRDGETRTCTAPFRLLRGSKISLSAAPVSGGRRLTGTLKRINFDENSQAPWIKAPWASFAGQKVSIQYRSGSTWITASTVKTRKNGTFKFTTKLGKRQWRAVFAGSATTAARTSTTVTG
ncbi:hypothetical protein [Kineosporia sp. NBRC 101731]|uniref:hypothetical protein n=1 Tax=Kineosporia sp. NBRC 101731 TaxID=3032199 RepID=UPI00255210FB|nr:hypothetical protein [Kineosporia sp. NBRC 101731]